MITFIRRKLGLGGYGLGRLVSVDERDRQYSMGVALGAPGVVEVAPRSRYWTPGPILDQRATSRCVGYAWAQWAQTLPTQTILTRKFSGDTIYFEAKKIDGFKGEGSFVRAGVKVLKKQGRVASYVWAYSLEELKRWILTRGPVVVGTLWYDSMFSPPLSGIVKVSGKAVGGHAYVVVGYSMSGRFTCVNSWGRNWGVNGKFAIFADDLWDLISVGGEACAAIERPVLLSQEDRHERNR